MTDCLTASGKSESRKMTDAPKKGFPALLESAISEVYFWVRLGVAVIFRITHPFA